MKYFTRISIVFLLLISLMLLGCSENVKEAQETAEEGQSKESANDTQKDESTETKTTPVTGTLGSLEIGDRVIDPSWKWEHRLGFGYSGEGEEKPVTWIVVGKDHFDVENGQSHVTLLSEEIIGLYSFDESTDRGNMMGSNHWGDSGTTDYMRGIRPFLNETFVEAFSNTFYNAVFVTNLPSAVWDTGDIYITEDRVFVLCRSEMDRNTYYYHPVGNVLPYFDLDDSAEAKARRSAKFPGHSQEYGYNYDDYTYYLTRTPSPDKSSFIYSVTIPPNDYSVGDSRSGLDYQASGLRPAINILSTVRVSDSPDSNGVYLITSN